MASAKGGAAGKRAPVASAVEQLERRDRANLAAAAQAAINAGKTPTVQQRRALKAHLADQVQRYGAEYAHNCPKKDLSDKTGVQQKILGEQSRRFGLTYHTSGKTVDLFALLSAWFAWASENKHLITRMLKNKQLAEVLGDGDDESLEYWQTELVKERTLKERDARAERDGELQPARLIIEFLQLYMIEPMRRRQEQCQQRTEPIEPKEIESWYRQDIANLLRAAEATYTARDEAFDALGADAEGVT